MTIRCNRQQSFINRVALLGAVAFFALTVVNSAPRTARAAAKVSEVMVYAAADEASPVIESVHDGGALSPMGEMTGAGGEKWFMVKTRSGNVGWIRASDNAEARRVDEHFRTMPRETVTIGTASASPEPTSKASASGATTIPVIIERKKVLVQVTLTSGLSSTTANLVVDTGANQSMISKRLAGELRLLSVETQTGKGLGIPFVADVGRVESVKVGDAEVKNMRVSIHDGSNRFGGEGLLGFDFLGQFQMSVDTDKKVMVLTPRKQ